MNYYTAYYFKSENVGQDVLQYDTDNTRGRNIALTRFIDFRDEFCEIVVTSDPINSHKEC